MDYSILPTVNATLNALGGVCLVAGYVFIRQGRREAHKRAMLAAFTLMTLFFASYLLYHFQVGSVRYQGEGAMRTAYLAILLSHTVLATAVPFLAIVTLRRAFKERFDKHKALARWTLPIWLYVSVTGVVVYWMLYRL